MNKLFESLNNILKSDKPRENRRLRHPKETEIIDIAKSNLSQSEMGAELLSFLNKENISIAVLRGRYNRSHTTSKNTIYITVYEDIDIRSADITIHLIAAIRQAAQEYDNMLRRVGVEQGESIYVHREGQKFEDKLYWQTGIVYELGKIAHKTEFIDSFTLMGYGSLIEAYEQDLNYEQS